MAPYHGLSMATLWFGLQAILIFQLFNFHHHALFAEAKVACQANVECENKLRRGSECIDGFCSNPFFTGGCLEKMKNDWKKIRACHSEDPSDAVERGVCVIPDSGFDYTELRISPQDWVSGAVETWILQILMSEMLGIPVTVETGVKGVNADFYNLESRIEYGRCCDYNAMNNAKEVGGDCTKIKQDIGPDAEYKSCFHFIPENWLGQNPENGLSIFGYNSSTEAIDPPIQLGAISQESWFIPKFTAGKPFLSLLCVLCSPYFLLSQQCFRFA